MLLLLTEIDLVVFDLVWWLEFGVVLLPLIFPVAGTFLSTLCCHLCFDTSLVLPCTPPKIIFCCFICFLARRKSNFRVILSLTASSARPLARLGEHEQIEEVGTELGGWVARVEVVGDHGR